MASITKINNTLIVEGIDKLVSHRILKALSLRNEKYYTLLRMGKVPFGMKTDICYASKTLTGGVRCPVGAWNIIKPIIENNGIEYTTHDLSFTKKVSLPKSTIELRDYQVDVMDACHGKFNGVFHLSTGFGKSIIALKLIENLSEKALIVVPKSHLLKQYESDIKSLFGDGFEVGKIQANTFKIGDITIATIQTLSSLERTGAIKSIKNEFGIVIVDECHEFITSKRIKAIQGLNPTYLFGLTGTPERTDKQCDAIEFIFGEILISKELPTKSPKVKVCSVESGIPVIEYHEMIDMLISSDYRNDKIASIVKDEINNGRRCLILTKRVDHAKKLATLIEGSIPILTEMKKKDKDELLAKLRLSSEFTCIIGTYQLLGTGSDIPSLDTLIFAGDIRSQVLSRQSVGRILRIFKDKQEPLIIDICDRDNGILMNQFKNRFRMYRSNKWSVEF